MSFRFHFKKSFLTLLCILSLVIMALPGCGAKKEDGSEPGKKVVLNEVAHSIFYAPMYAAIEEGYFKEEGIDLELVTGFGADKTMTAVLSGEADIGFMGPETTVYTYNEGASDVVLNFAQLTQRAGNFLVAREPVENFKWSDLKGKNVLGGRAGGMPEMVFEFVLKKNNIDPMADLMIDQSIDFGSTAAAFSGGQGDFTVELYILLHYKRKERRQVPLSFPNLQLHFLFADCHFVHYLQHSVFNLFLACPPSPLTRFYLLVRFPDSHALFLFDRYKAS